MRKLHIFVVFLLLTAYCLTRSVKLSLLPGTVSAHSSVQVVKMTPKVFEPQDITVDENSTIIFVNQDQLSRWPASNNHPTHELYPEFDPKHEIKPGESWSFKAKKVGTWKYHDHLDPHLRGTITVTKEEGSADSQTSLNIFESLKNYLTSIFSKIRSLFTPIPTEIAKPEEFKKLTPEAQFKALTSLAKAKGSKEVWEYISQTFKGEAGSSGNIHDLAHLGGKLIYEEKGISGISTCTSQFAFGCYHGLLDVAFAKSLKDLPQAESQCEKVGAVNSGPYGSCIHGIGHGIASFYESNNLKAALQDCEKLNQGHDFCYDGVFMEFVRSANPNFYSKEKPLYPCDELETEFATIYSVACGRNQPSVLMGRLGLGFEQIVGACQNNKLSDQFKNSCFEALGFSLAASQDADKIIAGCKTIKNTHLSGLCFKSAAGELIFQDAPSWPEKSKQICDASPLPSRKLCHDNRQRLIKEYGRQPFSLIKPGEDESEYVRSQMRVCYENAGSDDCYKNVAKIFSQQFDLKKTLTIFATNEKYPEIYARCHEVTHYLARSEYEKFGSIAKANASCDSTCHGGCYHGVLEQYLKDKNLSYDQMKKEFAKVCGKKEDFTTPLVFNECLHGLGHAAMFVTDMEVPTSLSLCDTNPTQDGKERCYSGVFMENSSSSTNNDHPGRWVKTDDPLFPCNSLPEKYAKICYRYQSSYFALITKQNWQKTADLCLKVPKDYQDDCFRTIGTNQVGLTQDTSLMRKNCSLMPDSHFQEVCLTGVISSFAYRFVGDTKRMEDFCIAVATEFQQACFRQMGTSVIDWVANKKDAFKFCDDITNTRFSSWCKSALNGT